MKKMIATLLALMMLMLPFAGLAETSPDLNALFGESDVYTTALEAGRRISFDVALTDVASEFTGESAVDQVIFDLLTALDVSGYVQGDEMYYAIGMKQESGAVSDILTLGCAVAGEDTYLLSNLIGGTIVVAKDEVQPLLERLIDMLVVMGALTERQAGELKAQLTEVFAAVNTGSATVAGLDEVDFMALDFTALFDTAATLAEKVTVGEVDVLPRNCDAPASMVSITLTPDEMKALIASVFQFVKDNPNLANAIAAEISFDETIAPQISGVSGDPVDFMGFIDMVITKLDEKQLYTGDTVMRIWLDEDGEIVSANIVAPVEGGEIKLNTARLTVNDAVQYSFLFAFPGGDVTVDAAVREGGVTANVAVAENGETRIAMRIDYTDRSAENLIASDVVIDMTITEVDVNSSYTYGGESYSTSAIVDEVNIGLRITSDTQLDGIDFVETDGVTVSVGGKEYATVNINVKSEMAGPSIMTGDVVRPVELSEADFANWFVGAFSALYAWAQNALFSMPSSLINLMNTGF